MVQFCVLSSGSKANCLYFSSRTTRILVDCGLSAREAVRRLASIGVDPQTIDGVVVSHEHSDHVSGVPNFSKKFRVPVFANRGTLGASSLGELPSTTISEFQTGSEFSIGDIVLEPLSVSHDATDPVAFRLVADGFALGIITDLGQLTTLVRERTRGLDALVLESNHCPELLLRAPYPWSLKQRISGRSGHLSNLDAAALVEELNSSDYHRLQVLVAAHISEKSNQPQLALGHFRAAWQRGRSSGAPQFAVASAYHPTELYCLA